MSSQINKKIAQKTSKFSLKEFVWFGFNFVFGGTFVTTYATFANMQKSSDGNLSELKNNGLGLWVLLV
jgi:hypothetical protein